MRGGLTALQRAEGLFEAHFSARPTLAATAPGRVNLIGEHTDYSGGFVLPIAIDRVCVAAGRPAADRQRSRIVSEHGDRVIQVDLREPILPNGPTLDGGRLDMGGWGSYAVGVLTLLAQRARERGQAPENIDLAVASDVPLGSGLSSSASVEMAVCTLAAAIWGADPGPVERAELCRRAEHSFAGVPCGIMDQLVSAMGRKDHAVLIDCRSCACEHVPMPEARTASVLVFNSNVRHALASGEYAQRRRACADAAEILGVPELRDATLPQVEGSAALRARPDLLPIARHVTSENARTLSAARALLAADLAGFGALMNASHESLRDDYRVSCTELDTLVDLARNSPGVHGARMTGGGFGGCIVALCRASECPGIAERVRRQYLGIHGTQATAFITSASPGAAVLRPAGSARSEA